MAGVDMVHVPYKGTGAVMPDLLAGRVPMMFENLAVMTPHIRKGSLLGWFALLAPAKTSRDIVRALNAELNRMLAKPAIATRFGELGAETLGGTPERAAALIRETGIKIQ